MQWHPNMTPEEQAALLAEIQQLDQCYAEAAEFDEARAESLPPEDEEEYECFDPRRDGAIGWDGQP